MELKGSCHCEKVSFTVLSHTPAPFMRCYCSICRKCQGGGGYAINIMGQYDTLKVTGKEHLRYFCGECGCHLYAYDKKWSAFVYPYACAIDTPLPELDPKDVYHIMLDSKANWAETPKPDEKHHAFKEYPDCSLEDWHKANKQYI
ncbi:hypothetical protein MBANPS3_006522 [Mucor bainieri]